MSSPKLNKGGRPPRVPGEKLQRINLTLRPSLLYGLELIARQRGGISLSQAAEYAIASALRSIELEGKSLLDIAEAAINVADMYGSPTERVATHKHVWRLLRTPERLRTPEENFILEVYNQVKTYVGVEDLDLLVDPAREAFRIGTPAEEVASKFLTGHLSF